MCDWGLCVCVRSCVLVLQDTIDAITDSDDSGCESALGWGQCTLTDSSSDEDSAMGGKLRSNPYILPRRRGVFRCLELFSGQGNLSKTLRKAKMDVVEFDILRAKDDDITNKKVASFVKAAIPNFDYVHFGIPCSSFSCARFPRLRSKWHPAGIPSLKGKDKAALVLGEKLFNDSCDLIHKACMEKKLITIENPASSMLWKHPRMLELFAEFQFKTIRVDAYPPSALSFNLQVVRGMFLLCLGFPL